MHHDDGERCNAPRRKGEVQCTKHRGRCNVLSR